MLRLFYAIILGLVGAALLHLCIIFLLPSQSSNSVWKFVESYAEPLEPKILSNENANDSRNLFLDPLFKNALCRFDLSDSAVLITASGSVKFWTISVFDNTGTIIFSGNDRIADTTDINLAIVNRDQLIFIRQNTPDIVENSIVATSENQQGFALVRVFAPDNSWQEQTDIFLNSMRCEQLGF